MQRKLSSRGAVLATEGLGAERWSPCARVIPSGQEKSCGKCAVRSSPALAGAEEPYDLNGIFHLPIDVTWKVIYFGLPPLYYNE